MVTLSSGVAFPATPLEPPKRPTLVVLVTVDQLRGDYLARYQLQWVGGFARLMRRGAVFPRAMQDHAITETAPGHAILLSGRYSASNGIFANELGVPDSSSPVVGGGDGEGASPFRFKGTTLVDWLRARDSSTRFLSLSGKDRGAILPIGRSKGPVFWFADGRFVTSRYYADTLPTWVSDWNLRARAQRFAGRSWTLLLPGEAYPELDARSYEHDGAETSFPHRQSADPEQAMRELANFPWMDSLTLDLALGGVNQLKLGQRTSTDLLAVSLSTTDHVGHDFGPESREIHDQLLRLDRSLGWFLDSLAVLVPASRTIVVLTADHGVTSFPEALALRGQPGGRVGTRGPLRDTRAALQRAGYSSDVAFYSGMVAINLEQLRAAGIDRDSLATALGQAWRELPGVSRVYTPRSLAAAPATDVDARRWRRTIPPEVGWLISVSLKPGYIWANEKGWTTHGTSNADDVSVPIAFLGPSIPAGIRDRAITTADIAPTLARLLSLKPLEPVDGEPVPEVAPATHAAIH